MTMRILADLTSHVGHLSVGGDSPLITQVEKCPDLYVPVPINGKYVIPIPEGTSIKVDKGSYVLPVDGKDVSSQGYANLLARYPMYGFIYFNPLLTESHVGELDYEGVFKAKEYNPPPLFRARFQSGRSEPADHKGQAPLSTAILPVNNAVNPPRPGFVITKPIDITPYTGGVGTDEFMVYWKIYKIDQTHDVAGSEIGLTYGVNEPAIRSIIEVNQEPEGFHAYLSIDNGENWFEIGRLEQIAFCCKVKEIMLAFRNDTSAKFYLASYAVMF